MNNLIYSVRKIFGNDNGCFLEENNKEYYNIPAYQRGYKWSSMEVKQLLDDIDKFDDKFDNKRAEGRQFYCLQNITLVASNNVYFNVIDGQQRLTTLYILLSFLGQYDLVKGKLHYPKNSIRDKTDVFLKDYVKEIEESDLFEQDWKEFIEKNPEFDHQDIYYIFHGAQTIRNWFSEKEKAENDSDIGTYRGAFRNKLLHNVKLIVNNIEGANEEKVFSN